MRRDRMIPLSRTDKRCGFCGERLVKLSFDLLSCGECNVMYDKHDMSISMVALPRTYSARWKEVPDGVLVVLEKYSREVTEVGSCV